MTQTYDKTTRPRQTRRTDKTKGKDTPEARHDTTRSKPGAERRLPDTRFFRQRFRPSTARPTTTNTTQNHNTTTWDTRPRSPLPRKYKNTKHPNGQTPKQPQRHDRPRQTPKAALCGIFTQRTRALTLTPLNHAIKKKKRVKGTSRPGNLCRTITKNTRVFSKENVNDLEIEA